jgi:hypothetical protein
VREGRLKPAEYRELEATVSQGMLPQAREDEMAASP